MFVTHWGSLRAAPRATPAHGDAHLHLFPDQRLGAVATSESISTPRFIGPGCIFSRRGGIRLFGVRRAFLGRDRSTGKYSGWTARTKTVHRCAAAAAYDDYHAFSPSRMSRATSTPMRFDARRSSVEGR